MAARWVIGGMVRFEGGDVCLDRAVFYKAEVWAADAALQRTQTGYAQTPGCFGNVQARSLVQGRKRHVTSHGVSNDIRRFYRQSTKPSDHSFCSVSRHWPGADVYGRKQQPDGRRSQPERNVGRTTGRQGHQPFRRSAPYFFAHGRDLTHNVVVAA